MNIIIADDHQLILDGLLSVLTKQFPDAKCHGVLNKIDLFKYSITNLILIFFIFSISLFDIFYFN